MMGAASRLSDFSRWWLAVNTDHGAQALDRYLTSMASKDKAYQRRCATSVARIMRKFRKKIVHEFREREAA